MRVLERVQQAAMPRRVRSGAVQRVSAMFMSCARKVRAARARGTRRAVLGGRCREPQVRCSDFHAARAARQKKRCLRPPPDFIISLILLVSAFLRFLSLLSIFISPPIICLIFSSSSCC